MDEKEPVIYRKIEPGKKYRVWKTVFNDNTFYKIAITQSNYDKTKDTFYIGLQFKKGLELANETDIIIKCAYENYRKNPLDKYNGISYLVVTDFEIVERQEQIEAQAFGEFRENLYENEINDDDLPF